MKKKQTLFSRERRLLLLVNPVMLAVFVALNPVTDAFAVVDLSSQEMTGAKFSAGGG